MDNDLMKEAYPVFSEWEKGYRNEAKECDYKALDWVYRPEDAREDEKKYRKDIRAALKGQIEFIKHLFALLTLPGPVNNDLYQIEHFLSMQHLIDKYFPDEEKPPISVTFWGGSPDCARIYVEDLFDIDFEDCYAYLYFSSICISNRNYETWTREKINEVIQHIKGDMEFDGDEVKVELFDLDDDWEGNKPGSHEIFLFCDVKELGED